MLLLANFFSRQQQNVREPDAAVKLKNLHLLMAFLNVQYGKIDRSEFSSCTVSQLLFVLL